MRSLNDRIEAMYARDRLGAWTFVAVLWVVILFVLFMVWQVVPDPAIRTVLAVAAGAVLIMDAYKWARLRWELSLKNNPT